MSGGRGGPGIVALTLADFSGGRNTITDPGGSLFVVAFEKRQKVTSEQRSGQLANGRVLREDDKMVLTAASEASQAADYLRSFSLPAS